MRWKAKNYTEWHSHFVWFPKKVKGEWVWLERVLRRGRPNNIIDKGSKWRWEYVDSEFDLIKQAEEKYESAQMSQGMVVGQGLVSLGPIPQYKPQMHPEQ